MGDSQARIGEDGQVVRIWLGQGDPNAVKRQDFYGLDITQIAAKVRGSADGAVLRLPTFARQRVPELYVLCRKGFPVMPHNIRSGL